MNILEQCQIWNENGEYPKIIDALEKKEERSPEEDSELARAYNNAANPDDAELYVKALDLLLGHEEYFQNQEDSEKVHLFNFRVGYAYYYLDRDHLALPYFEKALEARPNDSDTAEFIRNCEKNLTFPQFRKSFKKRTKEAWTQFGRHEARLRELLRHTEQQENIDELVETCRKCLEKVFASCAFELGINHDNKYELILSPEGSKARLFELVYFQEHIPEKMREDWVVVLGRQPSRDCSFKMFDYEIQAKEVQVWTEKDKNGVTLELYCEKLLPLLREDREQAWMMLSVFVDQTLGEITAMSLINGFEILDAPKETHCITLDTLPDSLKEAGFSLNTDAKEYLKNNLLTYTMQPLEDRNAPLHFDVYSGATHLPMLLNEYIAAEENIIDVFHADGAAAGFFYYPVEDIAEDVRTKITLEYRTAFQDYILEKLGPDSVTFLGGGTGLYNGYIDVIAWDLEAVLGAAADFFRESFVEWVKFHTFRRTAGSVVLIDNKEILPQIHEDTDSLLSPEDIEAIENLQDDHTGYFEKIYDYLNNFVDAGVSEGRFTYDQAKEDLTLCLWYAYACLNIGQYSFYSRAAEWLSHAEKNAQGCGMWFYRYSVALMYTGKTDEAFRYAEEGTEQEADYPWIWLQAAKLRAFYGKKQEALDAAEQGLKLVPGDYEFTVLKEEILRGASIEEMELHWINPLADQDLQNGLDEDEKKEKLQAISCIRTDKENLADILALFGPDENSFVRNDPYCHFSYQVQGNSIDLHFLMNDAGLSKFKIDWMKNFKKKLDSEVWLSAADENNEQGQLTAVYVRLDQSIALIYQNSDDKEAFFSIELD